jgi:hypothetical protein
MTPPVKDHPKPPFPKQQHDKPGIESDLDPRPEYRAPAYRPADGSLGR